MRNLNIEIEGDVSFAELAAAFASVDRELVWVADEELFRARKVRAKPAELDDIVKNYRAVMAGDGRALLVRVAPKEEEETTYQTVTADGKVSIARVPVRDEGPNWTPGSCPRNSG